ncbi:MAG: alpha/beta hydrolase [Lachnospiraceae bacterium]|nr:alpha/beta hydrolase [Lachnospiraceae bacterium]
MIHEKISIKMPGSEEYAAMYTYIPEYSESIGIEKRPMIVICPGGGYDHTSDREAEPLALSFNSFGYCAAVVRYSTGPSQFPIALSELAFAVETIRENAEKWHIDADRIIVQGSSAGGHLAACLGVFWNYRFLSRLVEEKLKSLGKTPESGSLSEMIKPDGLILDYPVISSGTFRHAGSSKNIAGSLVNADDFIDEKGVPIDDFLSIENRVTKDMPPCFIWHTFEDNTVPVQNSLILADSLCRCGVNTELHIFPHGCHGLGLANALTSKPGGSEIVPEVAMWLPLVRNWLERNYPLTLR